MSKTTAGFWQSFRSALAVLVIRWWHQGTVQEECKDTKEEITFQTQVDLVHIYLMHTGNNILIFVILFMKQIFMV